MLKIDLSLLKTNYFNNVTFHSFISFLPFLHLTMYFYVFKDPKKNNRTNILDTMLKKQQHFNSLLATGCTIYMFYCLP